MKMLEAKIEALTKAVEALTAQLATALPVAAAPKPKAKPKAPETKAVDGKPAETTPNENAMTMEEMTRAALALSRDGKGDAVRAKLKDLGVTRISLLSGAQSVQFAAYLGEVSQ